MNIRITADSTCDLSPELVEKYNVKILPLQIVMDEKPYKDGVEIKPSDIFEYVESRRGICHTTAINIEEYSELFEEELKSYDAVVQICIISDYSACYQNACLDAGES